MALPSITPTQVQLWDQDLSPDFLFYFLPSTDTRTLVVIADLKQCVESKGPLALPWAQDLKQ